MVRSGHLAELRHAVPEDTCWAEVSALAKTSTPIARRGGGPSSVSAGSIPATQWLPPPYPRLAAAR
jgi:hypothetical protein